MLFPIWIKFYEPGNPDAPANPHHPLNFTGLLKCGKGGLVSVENQPENINTWITAQKDHYTITSSPLELYM